MREAEGVKFHYRFANPRKHKHWARLAVVIQDAADLLSCGLSWASP
jgi:hypothetical protein